MKRKFEGKVLYPVTREWIYKVSLCMGFFGCTPVGLKFVSFWVFPEDFRDLRFVHPEYLIAILVSGGWLRGEDWRRYVRYLIHHRLEWWINRGLLDIPHWEDRKEDLVAVQQDGGTLAQRQRVIKCCRASCNTLESTPRHRALAKFAMLVLEKPMWEGLIYSPWYLRLAIMHGGPVGHVHARWEQQQQKILLTHTLRHGIPEYFPEV